MRDRKTVPSKSDGAKKTGRRRSEVQGAKADD